MQQPYAKIVVKIGTNVLTRADGSLDITNISHLVDQLATLKKQGTQLVLVSSGAVGAGRELLPAADQLEGVVRRQMLSAIGQVRLMELYRQLFAGHQLLCGQILATKEDFRDRQHYLNMRNCLEAMLHERIVPVLNENDAVAITELMFTDNDELASLVTAMLNADALVILSSVDGLFAGSPNDPNARLIAEVDAEDESVLAHIAPVKSSFGRGGMDTKLRMAQQTARLGADVILANGQRPDILLQVLAGEGPRTRVKARNGVSNVKKWLAHQPDAKGKVFVNAAAKEALLNSQSVNSLLPIGVTHLEGDFQKGDLLRIIGPNKEAIGLGIAQYGAGEAQDCLGKKGQKALVHYDYLVVF
ncbi:MAG: glutamate 5-kinase [Bacteroidetes bacterium]|nr:MAG: glutamate 5-kinase [Bacteroidota bacterium]PTM12906.1 MAG: glutamate 5-kinase [Bacteroidota bacterium]